MTFGPSALSTAVAFVSTGCLRFFALRRLSIRSFASAGQLRQSFELPFDRLVKVRVTDLHPYPLAVLIGIATCQEVCRGPPILRVVDLLEQFPVPAKRRALAIPFKCQGALSFVEDGL